MKNKILSICLLLSCTSMLWAQKQPMNYSAGAIMQRLEKINTLGSVLYIAAHPDDENTRLISFMANHMHFRTGYLAATRGDGGQNLIGPEIREELGVIRTQELLAARSVDGGEQFFSRANDFGYSKHPDETFNVWDKQQVLADFVWAIRKFRPDVLITRFSQEPGVTHGHHTASAILAMEAYNLAGDPNAFPEQLRYVETWQPKRIFWNVGIWSYRSQGLKFDPTGHVTLDVGQYNPFLGKSYTEISALSRSMHKSQGFGDTGQRGSDFEYFKQWAGDTTESLFGGIETSWDRVTGSEQVSYALAEARRKFNPAKPETILPELLNARKALLKLPDQYWKEVKLAELRELILLVTGTYIEVTTDRRTYSPGDSIKLNLEIINRSSEAVKMSTVAFNINNEQFIYNLPLSNNQKNQFTYSLSLPTEIDFSDPYWLKKAGTPGMYRVDDQLLRGLPQNPSSLQARLTLVTDGQFLDYEIPVIYKYNDPVRGEVRAPMEIVPPVMINLKSNSLVFAGNTAKSFEVNMLAGKANVAGRVGLELPKGWKATPEFLDFKLTRTGEEQLVTFSVTPPEGASEGALSVFAEVNGKRFDLGKKSIDYEHIPTQILLPKAEVKLVKLGNQTLSGKVGYIMGAGDEVPQALQQVGFQVTLLEKDDVTTKNLAKFDAVILGVRAFNTVDWLSFKNQDLFNYVKAGGNLIVQYNTSHQLVTNDIAPYSLQLSRDRVAVEDAPVKILAPKNPVLTGPFAINSSDFDGWVQERGLYFPQKWSEELKPILAMNDPGESVKEGSLLVGYYGKGNYVYTGLSFFRELPAGVPGAYKLMINMISLGDQPKP